MIENTKIGSLQNPRTTTTMITNVVKVNVAGSWEGGDEAVAAEVNGMPHNEYNNDSYYLWEAKLTEPYNFL